MPIYAYRCQSCDQRFEELVRASADPPPCSKCGSQDVVRVLSAFSTEWKPSNVNW
ncbi:MAG: FmdB family zinc ribbon protein, partial [Gaiellaceae bacterium]